MSGRAAGRGVPAGRAGGRSTRLVGSMATSPGIPPEDDRRSTPSPHESEFARFVAQRSPVKSPEETTPEESPGGSPKSPASPSGKMEAMKLSDKDDRVGVVRAVKKYGTEGTQVPVEVNYVRVQFNKENGPFIYHVRFTPEIDSINVRRDIMRKNQDVVDVTGKVLAFTGMNLYLPVILDSPKVRIPTTQNGMAVEVEIEFLKAPPLDELIPFYNTLLRRAMRELKLVQIKHHYFMPSERIQIPQHKLEVWPGSVTKIVELDGGLLLCCEITHKVLRTSTALQMLREIYSQDRANFRNNAIRQLVGHVVLTKYNNKPYRIDDIDFESSPETTFPKDDGTEISFKEYFKQAWSETVTDNKQPMLIHQPKPRKGETTTRIISLCPEFCFMTGLTDDIRSDFRAMRDIAQHTRIRPETRHAKLLQFLNGITSNASAKAVFDEWKIRLDTTPYECKARVFSNEQLMFGNGRPINVQDDVSWSREATSNPCFASFALNDWTIVVSKRDEGKALDTFKCIQNVSQSMGFVVGNPKKKTIDDDSPVSYVRAIREVVTPSTQLIFILTPGSAQRQDRYNAVKKLCCCEIAVPSQVVRCATVNDERKMRSVCQKVALQMQCKIGGQPWIIKMPFKAAMFVGIDVYHDPNRQSKSCVAIVSSMNPECSRWFSRVFFQGSSEEIAHSLNNGLMQAAKKFQEVAGVFPDRVFVYRDGVGDGQIPAVQEYEVPQMRTGLELATPPGNAVPKLAVVVVQKRIDTRMILKSGPQGFDNPKSGTVLDRGVTRISYEQDFFLVSQHVTQGTVTPTHYVVCKDETNLAADKMQRLTYRMTFLYYNWPGCVRVPAPCQYAHKIAYLAGQNLHAPPKDSICDKLFFL